MIWILIALIGALLFAAGCAVLRSQKPGLSRDEQDEKTLTAALLSIWLGS